MSRPEDAVLLHGYACPHCGNYAGLYVTLDVAGQLHRGIRPPAFDAWEHCSSCGHDSHSRFERGKPRTAGCPA